MKIIESIKIKYFRSFADISVDIYDLTDINIFSWANDSWKSNILRALNLFFNWIKPWFDFDFYRDFSYQQIDKEQNLLEKWYEWQKNIHKHIDIEILLNDPTSITSRPQKISVIRRFNEFWYDKSIYFIHNVDWNIETKKDENNKKVFEDVYFENYLISNNLTDEKITKIIDHNQELKFDEINEKIKKYKEDEKISLISKWIKSNKKVSIHSDRYYSDFIQTNKTKIAIEKFLRRLRFEYIPAIKDKEYFSLLFSRTLSLIKEIEESKKSKSVDKALDELSNVFNGWEISKSLNRTHLIWSKFSIPEKLIDFFSTFKILTKEKWNNSEVYLDLRWDWVQVQYIPILLSFISEQERSRWWNKPIFIWWFEEPENSYEYKNIKKIINNFVWIKNDDQDELINYSKYNQIFITTHSKEILSIQNDSKRKEKISIYRVWRNIDTKFCSNISKFNEETWFFDIDLADDLGIIDESRLIIELEDKLKNERNIIEKSKLTLKEKEIARRNISNKYEEILEKLNFAEDEIEKLSKIIIICEWNDKEFYNNINNDKFIFKSNGEINKREVFLYNKEKDNNVNLFWLMDRDFIVENEKNFIEVNSNVILLDFYCLENYLYHPDNLQEYYNKKNKQFDIEKYKSDILTELESQISSTWINQDNIWTWRSDSKKIIDYCEKIWFRKEPSAIWDIYSLLNDDKIDFYERYRFFSMKTYCKTLSQRQWISKSDLSKTFWFKENIEFILTEYLSKKND